MRLRDANELGRYGDPELKQSSNAYKSSVRKFAEGQQLGGQL